MESTDSLSALRPVLQHVLRGWIPVNPQVQESIVAKLRGGPALASRDELRQELRGDLSLYLHCMRELSGTSEGDTSFADLFNRASETQLLKILNVESKAISLHSIKRMKEFQTLQLRDTIFGASATLTVAERSTLDADTVYSTALMRTLGLLLLAWNYPVAFQDATQQTDKNIDEALQETFGFAPSMLGFALAMEWKLTPEICASVDPEFDLTQAKDVSHQTVSALREACDIGEALVRASNPEFYPRAQQDLSSITQVVTDALGPHGMSRIQDAAKAAWTNITPYSKLSMLGDEITGPSIPTIVRSEAPSNPYLEACSENLREQILGLNDAIQSDEPLDKLIRQWMTKVLPAAGFIGSAIFSADLLSGKLVPIVKHQPQQISLRAVSLEDPKEEHFVASAFHSSTPLKRSVNITDEELVTMWASAFGKQLKFGVLYFESDSRSLAPDQELATFRAVVHAFHDCLNIH